MKSFLLLLLALVAVQATTPQGNLDRVLDLPGWDEKLTSRWFSGHVFAGRKDNKHDLYHHYLLIESERDPQNDPVLVWSNGGPGAPSLFGLMVELGPVLLKRGGEMVKNEYNWNKEANLLILNGPPPVGYSYCLPAGVDGGFKSCGSWTDNQTAVHNRMAIENLVKLRHPRLTKNEWVFSGESYVSFSLLDVSKTNSKKNKAGVYIPMLVRELIRNNKENKLKIRGMAVGNACMGTDVLCFSDRDYWWWVVFMRGHAQISDKSYHEFAQECEKDMSLGVATERCKHLMDNLKQEVGLYYEYDIYSECWYDSDFGGNSKLRIGSGGDEFCGGGDALDAWVLEGKVKRALNVPLNAAFHSADNGRGFDYLYGEKDLRPFYLELVKRPNFRTLVFSGDTDVSVNVFASQNWTANLGAKELAKWRAWTLDGNRAVVGYVTEYEGDFTFATLRGSGHMAPQFKARASFELLQRFLRKEKLKPIGKQDVTVAVA